MTETNINALCSVEAVFDGVDIEVTVEFSAGGGTFEHDELTAESREKANQHPISAITGLQFALDGKSNVGHGHSISDITNLTQIEHNDLTGRDASDVHPKESITGLKVTDSPEFADTQITPLAAEATYTPTVWTYLVGLFTTVPKSALQHLVKLWGVVNNLAVRIGLLEDNYILKYVVPVDTTAINLTTDKYGNAFNFVEGDVIKIICRIDSFVDNNKNRINIRFNDVTSSIYFNMNTLYTSIATVGASYYKESFILTLEFLNGELKGVVDANISTTGVTYDSSQTYQLGTVGLNASSINSIQVGLSNTTYPIPAGTVIIIKKK